jgi:hypothetical protein
MVETKVSNLYFVYSALQALKYLCIAAPFMSIFERFKISKKFIGVSILLVAILIYGVIKAIPSDIVYKPNIALSIKNMYIWYFYLIAILLSVIKIKGRVLQLLYHLAIASALAGGLYSIWIIMNFDGSPEIFYFYKLYSDMDMFHMFNFVRHGIVRAYGFSASSLTFALLLLFPLSYTYALFMQKKTLTNLLVFLSMFVCMLLTQQRNPIFGFLFSIILFNMYQKKGNFKVVLIVDLTIQIVSFMMLWALVYLGFLQDWSSTGSRVLQMMSVVENLIKNPLGYGIGSTGIANNNYRFGADLSIFTIVMDIGALGLIFYFGIIYWIIYKVGKYAQSKERMHCNQVYFKAMFIALNSMLLMIEYSNVFDLSMIVFAVFTGLTYRYYATAADGNFCNGKGTALINVQQ